MKNCNISIQCTISDYYYLISDDFCLEEPVLLLSDNVRFSLEWRTQTLTFNNRLTKQITAENLHVKV